MCSSTICSWSSFAAEHRDSMESPHVPKIAQGGLCDSWDLRCQVCKIALPTWHACGKRDSEYVRILMYIVSCIQKRVGLRACEYNSLVEEVEPLLITWNHGVLTPSARWCQYRFERVWMRVQSIEWMYGFSLPSLVAEVYGSIWKPWSTMDVICMRWSNIAARYGLVDAYSSHANVTAEDVFRGWPIEQHEGRVWFLFGALWRAPWRQDINISHASTCRDLSKLSTGPTTFLLILPLNSFAGSW